MERLPPDVTAFTGSVWPPAHTNFRESSWWETNMQQIVAP